MGQGNNSREQSLASAIEDLALPGDEALARKGAGAQRPDALALDFDEAYTAYIDRLNELPSESQFRSLQAIDSALSAMTGPANAELWTEAAVKTHSRWGDVRELARAAVAEFGWSSSLLRQPDPGRPQ